MIKEQITKTYVKILKYNEREDDESGTTKVKGSGLVLALDL